jgi:predicted dehydrogenase
MTLNRTGVAIIGAGYWGPNLIRNFLALPECELRWVCDSKPGRQAYVHDKFPEVPITADFNQVLEDRGVSAVVVATPVYTHAQLTIAALEAGKHVLVEKPFADTSSHAHEMLQVAKRCGLVLGVDHLFVYNPAILKMKELLTAGKIGGRCYAESGRVNLGPPASEVDVIWDLATHDLAMTYYIWGSLPVEVVAFGRRFLHPKLIDVAFIQLRFEDGSFTSHHVSWLSPEKVRRYFLAGNAGSLLFDDTSDKKLRQIDQGVDSRIGLKDDESKDLFYRPGTVSFPTLDSVQPLEACCRDFLSAIRQEKTPRVNGEAGLAVVQMLEAAEESIAKGGTPVRL